jgi:hypothetical protein
MVLVDAHRDNEKRFVARADEKLTAFVELKPAIGAAAGEIHTQRKDVIERPLDVQQLICSDEQSCVRLAFKTQLPWATVPRCK